MANLEIAEMCARSGANCGSLFLDLRFRELVKVDNRWLAPRFSSLNGFPNRPS
jgi:hypothetical protein